MLLISGTAEAVYGPALAGAYRRGELCVTYPVVLFVFRLAPMGRVTTLREVSVAIAVLPARERPGALCWVGIGAVVAGAGLAAL